MSAAKPESQSSTPTLGVAGLGFIGGSLALAAKAAACVEEVVGWDVDTSALEKGQASGVIDSATTTFDELKSKADILVLAVPTQAAPQLLVDCLSDRRRVRIVTDVASVKAPLCEATSSLDAELAKHFVPGHPIAGSEKSGVSAADAELFRDHRVILTPADNTDAQLVEEVSSLWRAVGAEVSLMPVDDHDRVLAATSHLPHLLAYALVDTLAASPTREDIFRYAAGGFRDFSRIASSDPVMWRDVALTNRDALLATLDSFEEHLQKLRQFIVAGEGEALEAMFRDAKEVRDKFARDLERGSGRD